MAQAVRAVYEDGHLRVLDPISLAEGEHVQVMILRKQERTRAALGDLVAEPAPEAGDTADAAELQAEIDAALATMPEPARVSEAIIQERQGGP